MGTDLPIVWLHGLLGDRQDWQVLIDRLPEFTCHALDLPGHGSQRHLRISSFDEAHQWLCRELATLGLARYHLAGYSLGGRLALYHASQQPAGLHSLLLENCHPGLSAPAEKALRLRHDEAWAKRFEKESLPAVLADWCRQTVFADLDAAARERQIQRRMGNDGPAVAAMLRATSLSRQPDLHPWLQQATLPVAYLSGNRDHKFHQLACLLASQSRKIRHFTLDGGHDLHTTRPEPFARLLREWVHSQTEETD